MKIWFLAPCAAVGFRVSPFGMLYISKQDMAGTRTKALIGGFYTVNNFRKHRVQGREQGSSFNNVATTPTLWFVIGDHLNEGLFKSF